jgi:predicted dinucleotide-binding enzyme
MNIGILGAGVVGVSLAKGWAKAGHAVMLSSREPDSEKMRATLAEVGGNVQAGTPAETVTFGEVVTVAVGWNHLPDVVGSAGNWAGKIVIDATNRFGPSASGKSASEDLAALVVGASVVKAFNTVGAEHMPHGQIDGEQLSMFIAGDDAHAKALVSQLVADLGFEAVDSGGLGAARLLDSLAQLWVGLARSSYGRNIGFRLVRGK